MPNISHYQFENTGRAPDQLIETIEEARSMREGAADDLLSERRS